MSALSLVHAFHCTRDVCPDSACSEAKQMLRFVEAHVADCHLRTRERDAPDGVPAECKTCRLWAALHRTRLVSATRSTVGSEMCAEAKPQVHPRPTPRVPPIPTPWDIRPDRVTSLQAGMPEHSVVGLQHRAGRSASHRAGLATPMKSRLLQLGPQQMRRLLHRHVASCKHDNCATCQKLRRLGRIGLLRSLSTLPALPPARADFAPPPAPCPNESCAICFEQLGEQGPHWTCSVCNHALHSDCWSRWAMQTPTATATCPLCRSAASFRRYD